MSETITIDNYEADTTPPSANGNGKAAETAAESAAPFDGRYSSFEQVQYKVNGRENADGARHVYGRNTETGKLEHLSHSNVLAAYGYVGQEQGKPPKEPTMPVTPAPTDPLLPEPTTPSLDPFAEVVSDTEAKMSDVEKSESLLGLARGVVEAYWKTKEVFGTAKAVALGEVRYKDENGKRTGDRKKLPAPLRDEARSLMTPASEPIYIQTVATEKGEARVFAKIEHEGMASALPRRGGPPAGGFVSTPEDGTYKVRLHLHYPDGSIGTTMDASFPWVNDSRRVTSELTTRSMPLPDSDNFARIQRVVSSTMRRVVALGPKARYVYSKALAFDEVS